MVKEHVALIVLCFSVAFNILCFPRKWSSRIYQLHKKISDHNQNLLEMLIKTTKINETAHPL